MRRPMILPAMVAVLVSLSACGAQLHGGNAGGAAAADSHGRPTGIPTPAVPVPSPAHGKPTPTPTPPVAMPSLKPAPPPTAAPTRTPAPTPQTSGTARLTFSGALSGALAHPSVICEQNIPQGGQGYMAVYGTLPDGSQHGVTIWSSGQHSATEIYEGTQAGEIDFIEYGNPPPGVSGFDWSKGATVQVHLTAMQGGNATPGSGLDVSGTITCG